MKNPLISVQVTKGIKNYIFFSQQLTYSIVINIQNKNNVILITIYHFNKLLKKKKKYAFDITLLICFLSYAKKVTSRHHFGMI